jgi:hypothetical protein
MAEVRKPVRLARRISDRENRGERRGAKAPRREKHGRGAWLIDDDQSVGRGRDHRSRSLFKKQ